MHKKFVAKVPLDKLTPQPRPRQFGAAQGAGVSAAVLAEMEARLGSLCRLLRDKQERVTALEARARPPPPRPLARRAMSQALPAPAYCKCRRA